MDINFKNGSSIEVSEDMGTLHSVVNIPTQKDIDDMLKFFGVDSDKMVDCPECLMRCQIKFMITHLNDRKPLKHLYGINNGVSFEYHEGTTIVLGRDDD